MSAPFFLLPRQLPDQDVDQFQFIPRQQLQMRDDRPLQVFHADIPLSFFYSFHQRWDISHFPIKKAACPAGFGKGVIFVLQ